jgi:hypothetical protein
MFRSIQAIRDPFVAIVPLGRETIFFLHHWVAEGGLSYPNVSNLRKLKPHCVWYLNLKTLSVVV